MWSQSRANKYPADSLATEWRISVYYLHFWLILFKIIYAYEALWEEGEM